MTFDEQGTAASKARYYWPNKMGRMMLLALEDVMGKNGVNAVLNLAKLRHLIACGFSSVCASQRVARPRGSRLQHRSSEAF